MRSNTFSLLLAGMIAAFWPVWVWLAAGSMDASNDYTGLLAAASAILLAGSTRVEQRIAYPLLLPTALTAAYAIATAAGVSVSLRAMLAFLALVALASAGRMGKRFDLTLAALSMLALPLAASLQFYFGYPLRVLAGVLSATLLQMNGIAVVREGAMLAWNGQLIAIDAPCSGVKMLWAGLYLACALAAASRLPARQALAASGMAILVIVAANAVRAAALFHVESGLIKLPSWAHETIGMITFVAAALAIAYCVQCLKGARR